MTAPAIGGAWNAKSPPRACRGGLLRQLVQIGCTLHLVVLDVI
jgi:hypothetical protein